jgi:hypothetical protein
MGQLLREGWRYSGHHRDGVDGEFHATGLRRRLCSIMPGEFAGVARLLAPG